MNVSIGPIKFAIVGTQRTGTSLIRTSLSSHPDILCHGEVFKLGKRPYSLVGGYWEYSRRNLRNRIRSLVRTREFARDYLTQLYADPSHGAIGLKLMLNQCKLRPYIWSLLTELDVKAVMVRRRNVLKTLVSRRAAEVSGVYHVSGTLPTQSAVSTWVAKRIQVNTDTLLGDLGAIEAESAEWLERLKPRVEFIEVVYEDYVRGVNEGNRKILEFLGVPQMRLYSDLEKVNPDKLGELVSNYEAVERMLTGTRFAECLDSQSR